MNEQEIIDITREALFLALQLCAPIMVIGLAVGLVVALFQALTQIQEMTLTFVPKIIAIFFSIFLLFPTFAKLMQQFTEVIADRIIAMG